jgi:hypothetical protein
MNTEQIVKNSNAASVTLDSATILYVSLFEDDAVLHAVSVLAKDFGKVFGRPARVVHERAELPDTGIVVWVASRPDILAEWGVTMPSGPESFRMAVMPRGVVLAGADKRGAIFAAYHFAEKVLGIDPLYFWVDQVPQRRESITLPADFDEVQKPATFKYRGWFINDEDFLVRWGRDREGQSAIGEKTWEVIFETILRCKGNMIIPGTFIFSDEPAIRLAGRRGLIISQHHCEILGTNTFRWPKDV